MNFRKIVALMMCVTLTALMLAGCGAIKTQVRYSELETNLAPWSGNALFFPEIKSNKIAIRIANSAAYDFKNKVQERVENILTERGYNLVPQKEADYVILLRLSSQEEARSANELYGDTDTAKSSVSGAILGGAAGYGIGGGDLMGAAIGAGIGAVGAMGVSDIGDSWVKLNRVEIVGQMLVLERAENAITVSTSTSLEQGTNSTQSMNYTEESNWKQHKQWFTVSAQKAGLKWEEAEPQMIELIARGTTDSFEQYN